MPSKTINIQEKFEHINDYWNPRIIGELNGQHVKIAKVKGEFVMHQHDNEDELFWVQKGILTIKLKDDTLTLKAGEFAIIPKGTPHQPIAYEEVELLLFEPIGTQNTGEIENHKLTRKNLEQL